MSQNPRSPSWTRREVLRGIMVENPRRFLAFVPKKPRGA